MPLTVLVTGIAGFVGSHFAEFALSRGAVVVGSQLPGSSDDNIQHVRDRLEVVECDLCDAAATSRLVERARADWIIHLAAQSFVGVSWTAPAMTLSTNILSQVNLLEAVRETAKPPRFLVIGSSDEYGQVEESDLPIGEDVPLRPLSPYALSKVTQDLMGYQYWKSYGLPIVRARAFNHEGPRRGDAFVTSSLARQIAEIEAGSREPVIYVGNLKARRDYTDVRDIVRGYWLLLQDGQPGEVYNLCSEKAWSIEAVLGVLLEHARVKNIEVREDRARMRPADVPVLVGDGAKIRKAVGWRPEIPFDRTLRDVLDDWRRRIVRP
jgi:GDP-4-dehydro-6-deoxy-D-mannose reductase